MSEQRIHIYVPPERRAVIDRPSARIAECREPNAERFDVINGVSDLGKIDCLDCLDAVRRRSMREARDAFDLLEAATHRAEEHRAARRRKGGES